eukprot:scaffold20941_cov34-Tisochrysis_lutea.AAC.5
MGERERERGEARAAGERWHPHYIAGLLQLDLSLLCTLSSAVLSLSRTALYAIPMNSEFALCWKKQGSGERRERGKTSASAISGEKIKM